MNNIKIKAGDIAFLDEEFVEIRKIDTVKKPIYKGGLFYRKPTGKTKEVITAVWWKRVGDNSGIIVTRAASEHYGWKEALEAERQAGIERAKAGAIGSINLQAKS